MAVDEQCSRKMISNPTQNFAKCKLINIWSLQEHSKWPQSQAHSLQDLPTFTIWSCAVIYLEAFPPAPFEAGNLGWIFNTSIHRAIVKNVDMKINNGNSYKIWAIHIFLYCAVVHSSTYVLISAMLCYFSSLYSFPLVHSTERVNIQYAQLHNYKC